MPSNPLPLDAAARDELRAKAEAANDGYWPTEEAFRDDGYIEVAAQFLAACRPEVILALLAAVRGAEAETARLDFMESLTDEVDQNICPPGHHGGVQSNWLLTHERQRAPFVREWQAPTLRAALDAARAHPPIQETDADA